MTKEYSFQESSLEILYRISNPGAEPLTTHFAVETNLALAASGPDNHNILKLPDYNLELSNQVLNETGINNFLIKDIYNAVEIQYTTSKTAGLWSFPLETFSRTLNILNKIYQASCFLLHWDLNLQPGEEWNNTIKISFSKRKE